MILGPLVTAIGSKRFQPRVLYLDYFLQRAEHSLPVRPLSRAYLRRQATSHDLTKNSTSLLNPTILKAPPQAHDVR